MVSLRSFLLARAGVIDQAHSALLKLLVLLCTCDLGHLRNGECFVGFQHVEWCLERLSLCKRVFLRAAMQVPLVLWSEDLFSSQASMSVEGLGVWFHFVSSLFLVFVLVFGLHKTRDFFLVVAVNFSFLSGFWSGRKRLHVEFLENTCNRCVTFRSFWIASFLIGFLDELLADVLPSFLYEFVCKDNFAFRQFFF